MTEMLTTAVTITRKQIQALGTTHYLAQAITKGLTPIGRQRCSFLYTVSDVLASVDSYGKRSIRQSTRKLLRTLHLELLKLDLNIAIDEPLEQFAAAILEDHAKFEQAVGESKKREKEFYETHGGWIKHNLRKQNNIVTFNM